MRAVLTLDGQAIELTERPYEWIGSVTIDNYRYRIITELHPVGPVIDPAGDGTED